MDCAYFEVPMAAGARSPRASFTISNAASKALDGWSAELRSDVTVMVDTKYWDGGMKELRQSFTGLRILEKAEAQDPWNTSWILADRRYTWERRKLFYRFNVTRRANAATIAPGASGPAVDWDQVAKWRFMPGQLRKKGTHEFNATKVRGDPYSGAQPWTALAAARKVLLDLGVKDEELLIEVKDNGVVVENLLFNGDSAPSVLDNLLTHARAGIAWLPQVGRFAIYSQAIDDPAVQAHGAKLFSTIPLVEGGGWPIATDLRAMAPERYRFYVQPDYEIRFSYDEAGPSGTALAFTLQNVVKLPENVTFDGKLFASGTYVPVEDALDMWIADEAPNMLKGLEMSLAEMRRTFFNGLLVANFVDQMYFSTESDKWVRRILALAESYRKVFRIHPDWMDRIEAWQPTLSALADPVTGHRVRSHVIMDYTIRPTVRAVMGEKRTRDDVANKAGLVVTNWFANIADVKDSPFWIKILNHDLGVFAVEQFHDMQGLEDWYYPGRVDSIPDLSISSDATWQDAKLADEFKLDVVLSVIFSEPADASRFLMYEHESGEGVGGTNAKGNGVIQDIFLFEEHARYPWTDGMSAAIAVDGSLKIEGGALLPQAQKTIEAVIRAIRLRLDETWADRVSGRFRVPGFDPQIHRPIGPMSVVVFSFDAREGAWTTLQIDDRTPPPSLREQLPPSVRRIVYKEVGLEALTK